MFSKTKFYFHAKSYWHPNLQFSAKCSFLNGKRQCKYIKYLHYLFHHSALTQLLTYLKIKFKVSLVVSRLNKVRLFEFYRKWVTLFCF